MGKRICFGLFVCFHCFLSVYFALVYIHQVIYKLPTPLENKASITNNEVTPEEARDSGFVVFHGVWVPVGFLVDCVFSQSTGT